MALDPNFVTISDANLLMYYYFEATPTSGVAIVNQAANKPGGIDDELDWYSDHKAFDFDGAGLYGVHVTDDVDPMGVPGQWGDRNPYAASGDLYSAGDNKLASYHRWETGDTGDFHESAISHALASGEFTLGMWIKPNAIGNLTSSYDTVLMSFTWTKSNVYDYGYNMQFHNSTDTFRFAKSNNGVRANIGNHTPSGSAPQAEDYWYGWTHVVLRVTRTADGDGNYAYMFVNGEVHAGSTDTSWGDGADAYIDNTHAPKYLSIGGPLVDWSNYQGVCAWRDFWFFDRALTSGEIQYIFNHDISTTPVLQSTDNDLLLWYRMVEGSGQPVRSWAKNTPTETITNSDPIDTYLYHFNDPEGTDEYIYMIDYGFYGTGTYPTQWDSQPDQPKHAASGNTSILYHALRGESIDDTTITQALCSGSFTMGAWFSFETTYEAAQRLMFSFDRGNEDPGNFACGFHTYEPNTHRVAFNTGTGSDKYIYNNLLGSDGYGVWNHFAVVHTAGGDGDGKYARIYINGELAGTSTNPSWDSIFPPYFLTFFNNHDEWSDNQWRGAVKDFVFYNSAKSASAIEALYDTGIFLITTETSGGYSATGEPSGVIGGYYQGRARTSGEVTYGESYGQVLGGFTEGWAYTESGVVGGYYQGRSVTSGESVYGTSYGQVLGGYMSGVYGISGIVGGYFDAFGRQSGVVGGYVHGYLVESGVIGGYTFGVYEASGTVLGGFINGALPGSGVGDGSFTVKGIGTANFDAQLEVQSTYRGDFDAFVEVYKAEQPPSGIILHPETTVVGTPPSSIWFLGSGTVYNNKTIDKTIWNFGDLSSEELGVASGTDGAYATTYTYESSGLYIASFRVIDSNGLTGNGTRIINLADGCPLPDVELTASPKSGNAPLTVDFDYSITNIPEGVTITSTILYFGNNNSTLKPDTNYTYTEPGIYTPVLCVLDSRGVITCDSLTIGVNN